MREIVQLAVIIAIVITKGRFIAGARSEARSEAKWETYPCEKIWL